MRTPLTLSRASDCLPHFADSPTSVPSSPRRGNTCTHAPALHRVDLHLPSFLSATVDLRLGGAEKKAAKLEPGKFDIQDLDPLLLAQQLTAIEAGA